MSKLINEGKGILNGLPCHRYIIRNLANERDILEFERSFIEIMYEHNIPDEDIDMALITIGNYISKKSPIYGKSFDIRGNGPAIGGIAASVLFDPNIPSYGKCVSYYRKYDKSCHACVLCDISKRYNRFRYEEELSLIRFVLEKKDNYLLLVKHGLHSGLFRSSVDITEYASSLRCYPFQLYKNIIDAMPENKLDDDFFSSCSLSPKICKFLHGKLRRMRLPDAYAEKDWLDKVLQVWDAMIYNADLISKEDALQLLALLALPTGNVPDKSDKISSTSAVSPIETAPSALPENIFIQESSKNIDNPLKINDEDTRGQSTPNWQKWTASQKTVYSHGAVCSDESSSSSENIASFVHVPPSPVECSSSNCEVASEYVSENTAAIDLISTEDIIATGGPSSDVSEDSGNIEHDLNFSPEEAIHSSNATVAGSSLPSSDYIEVVNNADVFNEPVIDVESTLLDPADCYPKRLFMGDNLIFIPSVKSAELEHAAISLDTGNLMILTRFENAVLHDGLLSIEAFTDENKHGGILMWVSGTGCMFYSYLKNERANEILLPLLSRKTVKKLCYSPYLLYAKLHSHKIRIRSLCSLQTNHYLLSTDGGYESDYISVLLSYGVKPVVPGVNYKTSGNVTSLIFSYLPLYNRIFRAQSRRLRKRMLVEKADHLTNINEALGCSYLMSSYLTDASKPLFCMPYAGRFRFEEMQFDKFRFDGRLLLLSPVTQTGTFFFNEIVSCMSSAGLFHSCLLKIISLSENRLCLFVSEQDYEYVRTFINMHILEKKTVSDYVEMDIGFLMVGPSANIAREQKQERHKNKGTFDIV